MSSFLQILPSTGIKRDLNNINSASVSTSLSIPVIPSIIGYPLQTAGVILFARLQNNIYISSGSAWVQSSGSGSGYSDLTQVGSGTSLIVNGIGPNLQIYGISTSGPGLSIASTPSAVEIQNTGVTSLLAGSGIGISSATGAITITNLSPGVTYSAGSGISIAGNVITNISPGVTYSAGSGISIVGTTINNTSPGITYTASTGISIIGNAIGNTGVTSLLAGSGIGVSSATGAITITNLSPGVTYSAGSGISIIGTTISNTSPGVTYTAGSGISIVGTTISNA